MSVRTSVLLVCLAAALTPSPSALAQEESVRVALREVEAEKLALSRSAVEYDAKLRELEASRSVLDALTARHKQTGVARELKEPDQDAFDWLVDTATFAAALLSPGSLDHIPQAIVGYGLQPSRERPLGNEFEAANIATCKD